MSKELVVNNQETSSQGIIDMINIDELEKTMGRIDKFQAIVQRTLKQDVDFGIIPGSKKPSLLKPGAEKLLMMLGLRSEFEITQQTRDFEKGFFQYQLKCKLFKGEILITEGLGSCNTKESKYRKSDGFSVDNTVLKMAKKRALVDASLMVGALSGVFTQDIEDMDLQGNKSTDRRITTDQDGTINKDQGKKMYAIGQRDGDLIKEIMKKYNYKNSADIKKIDYDKICKDISEAVAKKEIDMPEELKRFRAPEEDETEREDVSGLGEDSEERGEDN